MSYFGILLILSLAAGRLAYLLVHDEIARPIREWIWLRSAPMSADIMEHTEDGDVSRPARMYHRVQFDEPSDAILAGEEPTGTCADMQPGGYRHEFEPGIGMRDPGFFGKLVECVYCVTFWTSLLMVLGWTFVPELTLALATPLSVWAVANTFAAKAL